MSELTRRRFVRQSAASVAGVTAIGALTATHADAAAHPGTDPVIAYVKNPGTGEIAVLSGDREVTVHDRGLAAKIARAAR